MIPEPHEGTAWLKEFERREGRPLRVLHIGNIANNAYINAKIQRAIGIEADVCCYEYFHVMGCPEWEDSDFDGDIRDQFFPDWWAVDLKGFERPRWFAQGRLRTCQRYLFALRRGDARETRVMWRQLRFEQWLRCRSTPMARLVAALLGVIRGSTDRPSLPPLPSRRSALEGWATWLTLLLIWLRRSLTYALAWGVWRFRVSLLRRARRLLGRSAGIAQIGRRKSIAAVRAAAAASRGRGWRTAALMVFPRRLARLARTDEHHALVSAAVAAYAGPLVEPQGREATDPVIDLWRAYFPNAAEQLSREDYADYAAGSAEWRTLFDEYDVIQGYALDPLHPLLAGVTVYTAYEHGTLRDLPFEQSARGRLCAISYRAAPRVFVTNSDVIPSARRLGLDDDQMVFLPHAVDSARLDRFEAKTRDLRPRTPDIRLFSPTRHDWADGDPLWNKGNDTLLRGFAQAIESGVDCTLVLVDWGRHVQESKDLVKQLGVSDWVSWVPPMRKNALWRAYREHSAVVDQFKTPAIGSVVFESLALGCRVITALDVATVTEFFGVMPPLLNARDHIEVAEAIARIAVDPLDADGLGNQAREWFVAHHSTERILELQLHAYRHLIRPGTEGEIDVHIR